MVIKLSAGNQAKAGEIGGIETVLKAMNTHLYNNKLCVNGCCALWNMTSKGLHGKQLTFFPQGSNVYDNR